MIATYLFFGIFFAVVCAIIASAKNKSVGKAFLAGIAFGIFALVYYIFVGRNQEKVEEIQVKRKEEEREIDEHTCVDCGKEFCEYCNKELKHNETLKDHYKTCREKKERTREDKIIGGWVLGGILCITLFIYFLVTNPINLIPLFLVSFIVTPFFDTLFNRYKKKRNRLKHFEFTWLKKAISVFLIILVFILINQIVPGCPKSCNDNNSCTTDFCSSETGYKCMNTLTLNCKGNGICESGEYWSSDCPNCDDGKKCTADSYDTGAKTCINIEIKGCFE